ncbi:MAG: IS1380 family transposase [Gammaproteobacteria bacterium]|nr:IS1380 family transposase [Gammaproteobacteria bacterium]
MNTRLLRKSRRLNDRIRQRLRPISWEDQESRMISASNIHYDIADKVRAIGVGGIGSLHLLTEKLGLAKAINDKLKLLKRHLPYWESDHVLNIAYNVLCGGRCLDDIELRRNDEAFLDSLGAQRIPDPTTAGDFCRRFKTEDIETLMTIVNEKRVSVWQQQPASFFDQAIIEADGTVCPTSGECKEGIDYNYHKKLWGYHPLVITLANTAEPLFIVNRTGNRPSHEGAASRFDQALKLVREAGFKRVLFRGDTDFSQTAHLDGWDEEMVEFVFGMSAHPNLVAIAEALPETTWEHLSREPKYTVLTAERTRPENVKDRVVVERGYRNMHLETEDVAEFDYSPTACKKTYRMVVLRKTITVTRGQEVLFPETHYFFYITNTTLSVPMVVKSSNERCNQENHIAQLKDLRAIHSPVDTLESNWAYMVMASLAWTLKAWYALLLPVSKRWRERHEKEKQTVLRMEFRTFLNEFIRIPAQIVKTGRRIVFRLLGWSRWQNVFLRGVSALRGLALC